MNEFMQNHTVKDCYVIIDLRDGEIKIDRVFTDEREANEYMARVGKSFDKVTAPLIDLHQE